MFPRRGLIDKARKPKLSRVGPIHEVMWYPTSFDQIYLQLLRDAAEAVGIRKTIDCRILRRTFGSLQLRGGKRDVEVAALMGDRPETIRRHYARILAEEVTVELAPMPKIIAAGASKAKSA
jgi:integrase